MKIEKELARVSPDRDSVVTIGVFDGVHKGHTHLISYLAREARRAGRLSGVVTLRNHPASVLSSDFKPFYLTDVEDRVRRIEKIGVDFVVPVTFDLELSGLSARAFASLLQDHLQMAGLVIGPDFALGHRREGDAATLASLGQEMGFSVHVVEPLIEDGQPIKSTAIREALATGDVTDAAGLLGRNFVLTGTVVEGQGRGQPLGFPTTNLEIPEGMAVPGDGIYATWAVLGTRRLMAATSIGTRPTFGAGPRAVEAFIMDFEGDLYGQQLRLEFVRWLRGEERYASVRDLQEQVEKDIDQARAILRSP